MKRPQLFKKHLFVLRVDIVQFLDILPTADGFDAFQMLKTPRVVLVLLIVGVEELRILRRPEHIREAPVFICAIRVDDEGWQEVSQPNIVMQLAFDVKGGFGTWEVANMRYLRIIWFVGPPEELERGEGNRQCVQD